VFRHALEKWLNVILRGVKFKDSGVAAFDCLHDIETGDRSSFRAIPLRDERGDGRALLGGHSRVSRLKRVNGAVLVDGG